MGGDVEVSRKRRHDVMWDESELTVRVKDYLKSIEDKPDLDMEEMIDHLCSKHPEYAARKRKHIERAVERVFELLQEAEESRSGSASPSDSDSEEEAAKRAKKPKEDATQVNKSVNDTLTNMYNSKPNKSKNQEETSTFAKANAKSERSEFQRVQESADKLMNRGGAKTKENKVKDKGVNGAKNVSNNVKNVAKNGNSAVKIGNNVAKNDNKADNAGVQSKIVKKETPLPARNPVSLFDPLGAKEKSTPSDVVAVSTVMTTKTEPKNLLLSASKTSSRIKPPLKSSSHVTKSDVKSSDSKSVASASKYQSSRSEKSGRKSRLELQCTQPSVSFVDVGGLDNVKAQLLEMTEHLVMPHLQMLFQHETPPRGVLLHGPPGSGKSLLANALAGQLKLPLIALDSTELVSGVSGDSESRIRDVFAQATASAPCLLFLDSIEVIAKRREKAQKDMELRMLKQLLASIDALNDKTNKNENQSSEDVGKEVFVVGATCQLDSVDPALRSGERLDGDVPLGIPNQVARESMLRVMCRHTPMSSELDFTTLAQLTPGFVGSDLKTLKKVAVRHAKRRCRDELKRHFNASNPIRTMNSSDTLDQDVFGNWLKSTDGKAALASTSPLATLCLDDFKAALKETRPSSLREGLVTVPNVCFDDIGALGSIRQELQRAICVPVLMPQVVQRLGLDVPSGLLLCGPPGCGKTLLAKAVANQAGVNFISVKGPELMNMFVGESERAIRQVFQRARNSSPCVVFFDEIDSLCPRRSGSDNNPGSNRVVNQMLTELDGLESRDAGVYVIGATNRVDMIDAAILRPGRLTKHIFVGIPDRRGRIDILNKITRNGTRPKLNNDVDIAKVADRCDGYTGADLSNLVRTASDFWLKDFCDANLKDHKDVSIGNFVFAEDDEEDKVVMDMKYFEMALKKVRPSVTGAEKKKYDLMKIKYGIHDGQVEFIPENNEDVIIIGESKEVVSDDKDNIGKDEDIDASVNNIENEKPDDNDVVMEDVKDEDSKAPFEGEGQNTNEEARKTENGETHSVLPSEDGEAQEVEKDDNATEDPQEAQDGEVTENTEKPSELIIEEEA